MNLHEDDAAAQVAAAAAGQPPRFFKLPDFWTASPAAWFGVAEAQFLLRGTASQRDRFALVAAVLPEASARRVNHILAAPGDNSYDDLKAALLVAHQLTSYQKAEKLFSSEPLGDRRPSELLSEMLELVHPGEERTRLFAMLFLRRLPAAVRLQLTEDDHEDVRALADKADRCAASIHRHQQLLPVFAATADGTEDNEEQSDFTVAVVGSSRGGRFNQRSRGSQNRPRGGRGGQRSQSSSSSSHQELSQAQQARQAGLCRNHFIYGEKTYNCGGNCSWSGN